MNTSLRNWASSHPVSARWIIIGLFVVIGLLSFLVGLFWVGTGWYEAQWPLLGTVLLLAIIEGKKMLWRGRAPNRRAWVAFHVGMMAIFVSFNVHLGSRFPIKYGHTGQASSATTTQALATSSFQASAVAMYALEVPVPHKSPTWLRKVLPQASKSVKEMPIWLKILATLGVVAVILLLGYVIAALACALLCSEMALAGSILLILGWGGILVGGFFWIRYIWRKKNRRRRAVTSDA